ncbi:DDE-type integrase/transposase/recombinase [Paenarthrobacter sp. NPDC090522]|uniref:DDE-type integrase/transposase/recombinase n=1 Tax=Paenarthrobacter sp. NPDC090522 TaxID=3364383 RepID=UPI0037FD5EDB
MYSKPCYLCSELLTVGCTNTRPAGMLHVDVTKFGNIPDSGGHRFLGRVESRKNPELARPAAATPVLETPQERHTCVHTVLDDTPWSRTQRSTQDEKAVTAAAALLGAAVFRRAMQGITTKRLLSDNGSGFVSNVWKAACAELEITHKRSRPCRAQINGEVERFHRALNEQQGLREVLWQRNDAPSGPSLRIRYHANDSRRTAF